MEGWIPPKPQGDPKENIQPSYSTSGDLISLCFHPTPLSILWNPGQAPKSAGSGFATSSLRTKPEGGTGVAAAPNTWDVPHLELLEMPTAGAPTAGCSHSWRWCQGRVRLRHLPASPGNPFPPHPAPTPATQHSHPVGSAPPNTLKTNKKGAKKPPGHHPKLSQPKYVPLSAPHPQSLKKNKLKSARN